MYNAVPNTVLDAFGIIFIEALYAGLPIVTSKLGGSVEIVNDLRTVTSSG